MNKLTLSLIGAIGLISAGAALAENAVILEDFEDSIDSVAQGDWGGVRIPDYVVLNHYTRTGAEDPNVTHGEKALEVALSGEEGWVLDFMITLSEEASAKVREAWQSSEVARYMLRYDIIFPPGTSWMNSQVFFGQMHDEVGTPSAADGGKVTMSIALDLVRDLPEEGPIILRFAENFDAVEDPWPGFSVFVDHIRLVDSYAPNAEPVTYVLQSFEDAANPTGGAAEFTGWGGTPRTTYSQYAAADPEDIRVSEGAHALQVDFAGAGTWNSDFLIPLNDTKLAEILKLDQPIEERPAAADLARYTLRFDITYPDRDENGLPSWEVIGFHTLAQGYPFSQARWDPATGERQTVSLPLDQLNWSDSSDPKPALMFMGNGDWSDFGSTLFLDNFRLIDTGGTSAPAAEIKITSVQFDAKSSMITLKWSAAAGTTYAVDFTQSLGSWPTVLAPSVPGAQGTATYTGVVPSGSQGFFRVRPN
jgi:hypothetical protein